MKKLLITLIIIFVFVCSACVDSNNNSANIYEPNNSPVFWGKYYFFNKNMNYWKMKNDKGDTAYFQALDNDTISLAMNFWNIDEKHRINVFATPIQFVYWENGMKKRQYFAIVKHNNLLYFAVKKHTLVANNNLDYYIYLFKIATEELNSTNYYPIYKEFDTVSIPYGNQNWNMSYNVNWYNVNNTNTEDTTYKIYVAEYTAFDNMSIPQTYYETFEFVQGFGFYKYMDYKLVSIN